MRCQTHIPPNSSEVYTGVVSHWKVVSDSRKMIYPCKLRGWNNLRINTFILFASVHQSAAVHRERARRVPLKPLVHQFFIPIIVTGRYHVLRSILHIPPHGRRHRHAMKRTFYSPQIVLNNSSDSWQMIKLPSVLPYSRGEIQSHQACTIDKLHISNHF